VLVTLVGFALCVRLTRTQVPDSGEARSRGDFPAVVAPFSDSEGR